MRQRNYKNKPKLFDSFPYLKKQWDYSKNKNIDPEILTVGSNKKISWKCDKNSKHLWRARVADRTIKKLKCPFCSGYKPSEENNFLYKFPKLAKEWNYKKNKKKPNEYLSQSHQRVWWICKKGHEWESKITNRSTLKRGCPYCTGKLVSQENNLLTNHPKKAKYFDVKKNRTTPDKIHENSGKKYWWRCEKNHSYFRPAHGIGEKRFKYSSGCPYCKGLKISDDNNLKHLNPEIAKEWNYKKNIKLKPENVTAGSEKSVWWICKKNHEWKAVVYSRTGKNKTGCPLCSKNHTSIQEVRLYSELIKVFPTVLRKDRSKKFELDIYIPDYNLAIEYDGSYWHEKKQLNDFKKNIKAQKKGIELFRIREKPLPKLSNKDIITKTAKLSKIDINNLLKKIRPNCLKSEKNKIDSYLKSNEFINQRFFSKLISNFPGPVYTESLSYKYPEIAKYWDYKKNNYLTPNLFSYASNEKVWWKCKKSHSWSRVINNFVRQNRKKPCPICS
jgi:hypothetical protein